MGHRDSSPEDPDEYHAWAENYVKALTENHERWGIALESIEIPRMYFAMREEEMREEDADPVEPHPFDGYTIYWDKKKRRFESLCEFLGVPWKDGPGLGVFDWPTLMQKMQYPENSLSNWKAHLNDLVRKTAERYGMPPEWTEKVIARGNKKSESPENGGDDGDSGDMVQKFMLLMYQMK